jgi:putative peptidoglycan lipid II flippase
MVYVLSFWVGDGVISSFNGAVRLMEFPQGMFGISLATYLLPTLSGLAAEKNYGEFRSTLRHGLGTLTFLNLIASVLLFVLAEPIVRLIFQHGRFTDAMTDRVAFALVCLAPGLVLFSTVNVLARAFYALGDTRTPMKISIACLLLNLIFAAVLVKPLQQGGLGIANTLSAIVNVCLLSYALRIKLKKLEWAELRATLAPLAVGGLLAGLAAWQSWHWWENALGHKSLMLQIGAVFAPAAAAGAIYWIVALCFKVPSAREIGHLLFHKLPFGRKIAPP